MRATALTAVFGVLIVATFAVGGKEKELPAAAPPAAAPRVADAPPDAALKQMIDDLGSDDWRAREKAGRGLNPQVLLALSNAPPKSMKDVADRYAALLGSVDRRW